WPRDSGRPTVVSMREAAELALDIGDSRIKDMDAHGIHMQVVSYATPAQHTVPIEIAGGGPCCPAAPNGRGLPGRAAAPGGAARPCAAGGGAAAGPFGACRSCPRVWRGVLGG